MNKKLQGTPDHWPPRWNVCSDPCDMIDGPCACGAGHHLDDDWVLDFIERYGLVLKETNDKSKTKVSLPLGRNISWAGKLF